VRDTAGELDRRGGQHTAARSRIAQTQPQGARQAEFVICDKAIERTFAWLSRSRRLARDYERLPETSEAMIRAAMSRIMLRRVAA
jgi:transposase